MRKGRKWSASHKWSASQRKHFNATIGAREKSVIFRKIHLDRVRPKGPWSKARRARFEAKRQAKIIHELEAARAAEQLNEHPSRKDEANEKLIEWGKQLQREEIVASMKQALNTATDEPLGRPQTIYVLESGVLKRYMLRNVFIYVPVEKEESSQ